MIEMQDLNNGNKIDSVLLERFQREILSKVPHLEKEVIANASPLIDLTEVLKECAKNEYGLDLADTDLKVYGKFDSSLLAGSIKVRPAVQIIHDAIATGKLKRGQTIFEATSGNFGIALGEIAKLGLDVVTLVSRKLQEGVFDELRKENIHIMNLEMDICPAPGMKVDANTLAAKATAQKIRSQLAEFGFDTTLFDKASSEVESILAKQDIINLAKLLAKIYGGFCPEQYDNDLNVEVHRTITAKELDQQLNENNHSLADFRVVCTFGTGGTSGGISRYLMEKSGKKSVHVVFPLADQDVAGIRTKAKAMGLKFYEPERYAGQHEVDFTQAKRLLKFFVDKGYDIGESSALALYAVMQMANFGGGGKFVAIVADGIEKYRRNLVKMEEKRTQVPLQEAISNIKDYDSILWIHTMYTPRKEGIKLIANSLGLDESKISVPKARDVEQLLATHEIPEEIRKMLGENNGRSLLICMMGNTSLMAAQVLSQKGISAESLIGGISALSEGKGKQLAELVEIAKE